MRFINIVNIDNKAETFSLCIWLQYVYAGSSGEWSPSSDFTFTQSTLLFEPIKSDK